MDIEITGLAEIEANFRRVSDRKTLDRNVASAGRKVMKPVLEDAKRNVRVDDGDLKRSLIISSRKLKNGNRSVRVGPDTKTVVRADSDGGFDLSRKKRPANYAHLVEKGTSHSQAKPFLRPAFDKHSKTAVSEFGAQMQRGLERVIKKIGGGK